MAARQILQVTIRWRVLESSPTPSFYCHRTLRCHHRVDEHEEMYLFSIKSLIISCDHLYLDGKHEPHVWQYAILTEHALSKLKFVEVK